MTNTFQFTELLKTPGVCKTSMEYHLILILLFCSVYYNQYKNHIFVRLIPKSWDTICTSITFCSLHATSVTGINNISQDVSSGNRFAALTPPETNTETFGKRPHKMPPFGWNVKHFAFLYDAINKIKVSCHWKLFQVKIVKIHLQTWMHYNTQI